MALIVKYSLACRHAMLASHLSPEPACAVALRELDLEPVITARMRLGEGCGAACMMPLLDMALALFRDGITLEESDISTYDTSTLR